MKIKLLTALFCLMLSNISFGQISVSEIMYAPTTATESEWFEIYNNTPAPINLQNWKWKDATATIRTITATTNYTIQPNSFAVICEDSANLKTNYPGIIQPIIQTTWSALNNTGDNVIVIDPLGIRSDSISFLPAWGGSGGKSLERINLLLNPNVASNWGTSLVHATPNQTNSISPRTFDLYLSSFKLTPTSVLVGDSINIGSVIKNAGQNPAANFSYSIYLDANHDNVPQPAEVISTTNYILLNASDSLANSYRYTAADTGTKTFIGVVNFAADVDTTNNKMSASAIVGNTVISQTGLIINEVMYAPTSPEPEWVELYNPTVTAINIKNWKIADLSGAATPVTITTLDKIVQPGDFLVIAKSNLIVGSHPTIDTNKVVYLSNLPSLNNDGDDVTLINSTSQVSDHISYTTAWGGATGGFSTERRDPNGASVQANFGSSVAVEKSTPTRINSITPKAFDVALRTFTITPAFPVINDSLHLSFNVKNVGLNAANNVSLKIYKDVNRDSVPQALELLTTISYTSLNPNDSVNSVYVTLPDTGVGLKQYIGKVDFKGDLDTTNNKLTKGVNVTSSGGISGVIINEIMADPTSPEPEWLELYNNSDADINLKNWKVSDASATQITITTSDKIITHRDYMVLAKNNSILLNHPLIDTNKIIYVASLPSLNNDADNITIYSSKGSQSDNVFYNSHWGGGNGYSLERKVFNGGSNDSTNWATSVDCEKSSPTRANSFTNATAYVAKDLVINEIMSSPLTGNSEYVEIYNPSDKVIDLRGWRFNESSTYAHLTDSCDAFLSPGEFVVIAHDTTIFNRYTYLTDPALRKRVVINSSLSLSNDGETVSLYDIYNNLIDQVSYLSSWKNPNLSDATGYSLEKINPLFESNNRSSWSSSANPLGGTPLKVNSIYTNNTSTTTNVSVFPNPFSPDNDGFEDFTVINYKLKTNIAQIRAKIYDIKGRLVRDLVNNQISGGNGTIIFDGLDNQKQKLRVGIYIVFIEAVDQSGGVVETAKASVVVAAKL